jgi:SHS2 domain-containing protein
VREDVRRHIEVQAEDRESLLVSWLNELLYIFDVERTIFKRFEVTELGETSLKAEGYGELLDQSRHSLRGGLKAATYHMLKIEKNDGYSVRVIFDT